MSDVLWFNGRFTTTDEPVFTVQDRGLLFGDAVYEVLKFVDGAPILAAAHWQRLCRSLAMLEIRNPWTPDEFVETLEGLLERTRHSNGIIYLQVSRGAGARGHAWCDDLDPVGFVHTSAFQFPDEDMSRNGIGVITVEESRWARCEIKSVNLLPNAIAKTAARRNGAHEALFVNDGRIVEGASSNFFAVIDSILVTREKGADLLPGTVRDAVLELAGRAGVEVRERAVALSELDRASEALLTSTTYSVLPVRTVDGQSVGAGQRGPVTTLIQKAFDELVLDESARWTRGDRLLSGK